MTTLDLDKLLELSEKATPEVVAEIYETDEGIYLKWINPWSGEPERIATFWWPAHPVGEDAKVEKWFEALAELIESARNALPDLVRELKRLRRDNDALSGRPGIDAQHAIDALKAELKDAQEQLEKLRHKARVVAVNELLAAEVSAAREEIERLRKDGLESNDEHERKDKEIARLKDYRGQLDHMKCLEISDKLRAEAERLKKLAGETDE